MTVLGERSAEEAQGLTATFVVVLSTEGLEIPLIDGHDGVPLGFAELLLIAVLADGVGAPLPERLATVAGQAGCDVERLEALIDELVARRLLAGRERAVAGSVGGQESTERSDDEPLAPDARLVAMTPLVCAVNEGRFVYVDHSGRCVVRLDATELALVSCFRRPSTFAQALAAHRAETGDRALSDTRAEVLVRRLVAAGVIDRSTGADTVHTPASQAFGVALRNMRRFVERNERQVRERSVQAQPARAAGSASVRVVGIPPDPGFPPLALGMILGHARAFEDGRLARELDLSPDWNLSEERQASFAERPGIFLFSNYTWSHRGNLERSAELKRLSPESVTIHGGPDTPKYEGDVAAYFRAHPHVDVAVRGEGEMTATEVLAALVGAVGDGPPDLSALRDVPGVTFRDGDELVRTPDRDRITDLDSIPSPYLTGLFDVYGEVCQTAIIETNRGCPYSCTFCDWGSATLSRIRKFSLERVFAELEWCARNEVDTIFVADANFGIMERDVQIAEKVAELRSIHGYPRVFTTNYAKNTVKHLRKIVGVLADAGVLAEGLLSLQSMDTGTLKAINRSNIKVERYDELAREFRRARLPLLVDLMVGLPGQTTRSFRHDLQECVDREVTVKVFPTEVLVNSPMNDPSYREVHQIESASGGGGWYNATRLQDGETGPRLVVSTATFTRQDYQDMLDLRRVFLLCENFGVLRHLARWVRQEHGVGEVELYDQLRRAARADRDRWPVIAVAMQVVPDLMAPPVSWRLFIDELRRYLTGELGIADPALETVLAVQHALLPARGRRFPETLELAHDFAAWHRAMIDAKDGGHLRDWPARVPHLRDLPPAPFTVEDETQVCTTAMGTRIDQNVLGGWELASPVARAASARHLVRG